MTQPDPATVTTPQGTDPVAPENGPTTSAPVTEAPKPEGRTFTQAELDSIITKRIEQAQKTATQKALEEASKTTARTVEEQVAAIREQLEAQAKASEQTAVRSIVARATAGTHNPGVATQLILGQLGDLTSSDEDQILAKATEFLAANPYLVKTATTGVPAPVLTPAPGVAAPPTEAAFFTREQLDAITDKELAKDEKLLAKYLRSVDHLSENGQ